MKSRSKRVPPSGHAYSPAGELLLSRRRAARSPSEGTRFSSFRSIVWGYWEKAGRHSLPWRKTVDPYKILVSEIMLQQTQVERVIPKYTAFIKRFPTVRSLARAKLSEVLALWSGLGYNRRAKYLHDAALYIVREHAGKFPREYPSLRAIPGVGQYTANAVRVFAYNEYDVLLETNVRTAIIHHFLKGRKNITDADIERYAAKAAEVQDPREWHSALFDYGSYLKRQGMSHNARAQSYTRQSKFEGSVRQVRGAILRARTRGESMRAVEKKFPDLFKQALSGLKRDGLL